MRKGAAPPRIFRGQRLIEHLRFAFLAPSVLIELESGHIPLAGLLPPLLSRRVMSMVKESQRLHSTSLVERGGLETSFLAKRTLVPRRSYGLLRYYVDEAERLSFATNPAGVASSTVTVDDAQLMRFIEDAVRRCLNPNP